MAQTFSFVDFRYFFSFLFGFDLGVEDVAVGKAGNGLGDGADAEGEFGKNRGVAGLEEPDGEVGDLGQRRVLSSQHW
jgi:hypothetical protein